ncbi:hypothetical protein P0082_10790 [Candidatus Haliotispira prima]|uniref:Uncharacterized protein n=1 Tax=Candidatus Haliotispira prima TaxID=3034016 RepID=A0ABY8MG43_9SPIO|nr:hypothetical protein P0082_10790 [Candidatus Haliotispira prima]
MFDKDCVYHVTVDSCIPCRLGCLGRLSYLIRLAPPLRQLWRT